jgi:two-component system response regulator (stage 0 sporulation protein F)
MIKALVVDDEKDVELLFRQQFRKEVRANLMELHFAFSGDEALRFMKTLDPFDLIFLMSDINMPGMSGFDLLKNVKVLFPRLQVIMITAYDDKLNYSKAKEFGADDIIAKPVDFNVLRNRIFNLKQL